jgi:REP element-mobilizing transposase RayT
MQIFLDTVDYQQFVYLLGRIVEEFDIECRSFCVMPNHYHAVLVPTRPNYSEGLRHLNAEYAQWWNKRHGRVGHVFQGRFKAQIVEAVDYQLTLLRYVVMNPVRARLVERPEDWRWSSYRATAGFDPEPPFLACLPTLRLFGEDDEAALRVRFKEFVQAYADDDTVINRIRSNERILGRKAFKELVEAMICGAPEGSGQRVSVRVQNDGAFGTRAADVLDLQA